MDQPMPQEAQAAEAPQMGPITQQVVKIHDDLSGLLSSVSQNKDIPPGAIQKLSQAIKMYESAVEEAMGQGEEAPEQQGPVPVEAGTQSVKPAL